MTKAPLCLVADIGGTNTRVALADGGRIRTDSVRRFRNTEFPDLDTILVRYLAESGVARVDGACVAAAGPVKDGVATMTNLDWTIDGGTLTRATGAARPDSASLLNCRTETNRLPASRGKNFPISHSSAAADVMHKGMSSGIR